MKCYNCGFSLSEKSYCTSCGKDVSLYKKIMYTSNLFYNQGLEKANVRDLSGAINSLKQSLKFNRNNIMARNLLGLVYFEMGQTVEALREWVISKNISGEKNIADDYLDAIQHNQTRFNTIGYTITKYNKALDYCRQDGKDLAIIQLKKVLSTNPKFVQAHQLLALLYLDMGNLEGARRELNKCLKIDINNTKALRLLKEVALLEEQAGEKAPKKKRKEKEPEVHKYQSGNETIIQPINEKEVFNMHTVVNLIVGLAIGIGIAYFLILPARIQQEKAIVTEQLNEVSQQVVSKSATIVELEQQVQDALALTQTLQAEVDGYIGSNGKLELMNHLLNATYLYLTSPTQVEDIAYSLELITQDYLDTQASDEFITLYEYLIVQVGDSVADNYYTIGYDYYKAEDYANAIVNLEKAYRYDGTNGEALYNLANSYVQVGEFELAATSYEEVIEKFPGTEKARKSQEYLDALDT